MSYYGSGIEIASALDMKSQLPIDGRDVAADITERDAIVSGIRYEGMRVFVQSEGKTYQLIGGITNSDWVEASGKGVVVVADDTARDAIDSGDRYEGMIVYVEADEQTYQLVGGITNSDWARLGSGDGSGFGGKNYFTEAKFQEAASLENAKVYKEISAPAASFFDGGGLGFLIESAFQALGYPDGTPVRVFSTGAYPSFYTPGQVYYIQNSSNFFRLSTDVAGLSPVSGNDSNFGGGQTYTVRFYGVPNHFSVSNETTAPQLVGGSLALTFTNAVASAVGSGLEISTETIDLEDRGKTLFLNVKINNIDTDYVDNDLIFKAFDASTGRALPLFESYQIKRRDDTYIVPIYTYQTTTKVIVSIHKSADNATGDYKLIFGTFKLYPEQFIPASIIGRRATYTPTGNVTTNVTYTGSWKRETDEIDVIVTMAFSGANTQAVDLSFSASQLFNGLGTLTIDQSKLPAASASNDMVAVGYGSYEDSGTTNRGGVTAWFDKSASLVKLTGPAFSTFNPSTNTPITFASGDSISVRIRVPIVEWGDSPVLSTAEAFVKVPKGDYSGNAGTAITGLATNIPFTTRVNDPLVSWNGTQLTANENLYLVFSGSVAFTGNVGGHVRSYVNAGDSRAVSSNYTESLHPFAGIRYLNKGDVFTLRHLGSGTLSNNSVYHNLSFTAVPDLKTYSVYGKHEILTATSSVLTPGASGNYYQMTNNSILLPVGVWRLYGSVLFSNGGTAATYTVGGSSFYLANGANSGVEPSNIGSTSTLTVLTAVNASQMAYGSITDLSRQPTGEVVVQVTSPTTVFLVPRASMSTAANARITAYANAERIK